MYMMPGCVYDIKWLHVQMEHGFDLMAHAVSARQARTRLYKLCPSLTVCRPTTIIAYSHLACKVLMLGVEMSGDSRVTLSHLRLALKSAFLSWHNFTICSSVLVSNGTIRLINYILGQS